MKLLKKIILFLVVFTIPISAQIDSSDTGNVDIYLLDSYITPEVPYKFILSFLTSDSCYSKVFLVGLKEVSVSKELTDNHKIEIDLKNIGHTKGVIKYKIYVWIRNNEKSESQLYEVEIPQNIAMSHENDEGLLQLCCMGGVIFGIPAPTLVLQSGKQYFSLTKEIPLFSFYSGGYNYPFGYISAEYAHVFKADKKNFLRVGYKQIFQIKPIEYIACGLSFFSDLKGYNGLSPEVSFGLFQIQNTLIFFAKYRYNFQPDRGGTDQSTGQAGFHEFSIGLYSSFFSLNF